MITNNKVLIQPGEMSVKITLQTRTVSSNAGGFETPTWATIAEVWSRWINVHGSEAWAAQSVQAEQPATVTIRYRYGVDTTCSVLKGYDRFEITSIDDIRERHEYLELKVRRMRSG
jgi:SPP1 family predicted phage head-tail adaptor